MKSKQRAAQPGSNTLTRLQECQSPQPLPSSRQRGGYPSILIQNILFMGGAVICAGHPRHSLVSMTSPQFNLDADTAL